VVGGNVNVFALVCFARAQVVPDYIDVEATGFASNFLPGNNQGFLQQKITMTNTAMVCRCASVFHAPTRTLCLPVRLPACLSVCLSVCLSACLSLPSSLSLIMGPCQ